MTATMEPEVGLFFSQFPLHTYKEVTTLMFPEEEPTGCFYLEKGNVRQYVLSENGTELTIHIFNQGSFFPLTWVMDDIVTHYYYETMTPVKVRIAPKEKVASFLKQHPKLLYQVTTRLLAGLDKLSQRIESMTFDSSYKRIISILLYLARHFSDTEGSRVKIMSTFTHKDIASLIGVTRETVSRTLKQLEKKKLLSYKKQTLLILNLVALRRELHS